MSTIDFFVFLHSSFQTAGAAYRLGGPGFVYLGSNSNHKPVMA